MTDPFKKQRYDFEKSYSLPHTLNEYNNLAEKKSTSMRTFPENTNQENENKQAFVQNHIENNRELIVQLKNNIELLFRGSRLVGQVAFFPFKVLRWQCQINSESSKYHIVPFTLFPVIYNLNYNVSNVNGLLYLFIPVLIRK